MQPDFISAFAAGASEWGIAANGLTQRMLRARRWLGRRGASRRQRCADAGGQRAAIMALRPPSSALRLVTLASFFPQSRSNR